MADYTLRYARLVILEVMIEADNLDEAYDEAMRLEQEGELDIADYVNPPQPIFVDDISDYDMIWEVTPDGD